MSAKTYLRQHRSRLAGGPVGLSSSVLAGRDAKGPPGHQRGFGSWAAGGVGRELESWADGSANDTRPTPIRSILSDPPDHLINPLVDMRPHRRQGGWPGLGRVAQHKVAATPDTHPGPSSRRGELARKSLGLPRVVRRLGRRSPDPGVWRLATRVGVGVCGVPVLMTGRTRPVWDTRF